MICVGPDGTITTYPDGDALALIKALRTLTRLLNEHPEAAVCMAGACGGHDHAPPTDD